MGQTSNWRLKYLNEIIYTNTSNAFFVKYILWYVYKTYSKQKNEPFLNKNKTIRVRYSFNT